MEQTITKDNLKNELHSGGQPALELLYNTYGGMLFNHILQFVPDRAKAENLLVDIFSGLSGRLQEACDSHLSVFCWLQVESRKIILHHTRRNKESQIWGQAPASGGSKADYFYMLEDASAEHQEVFRELYIHGRRQDEWARQMEKDTGYVAEILRESLLIIRKKLG